MAHFLQKQQIVMEHHSSTPRAVTFITADTDPADVHNAYTMSPKDWADMDCPGRITLTIEPGNTLWQPEDSSIQLVGTESRSQITPGTRSLTLTEADVYDKGDD